MQSFQAAPAAFAGGPIGTDGPEKKQGHKPQKRSEDHSGKKNEQRDRKGRQKVKRPFEKSLRRSCYNSLKYIHDCTLFLLPVYNEKKLVIFINIAQTLYLLINLLRVAVPCFYYERSGLSYI